ncbi:MAG: electron transporter RnfB [Tenericutes bacterium HGW-Tenericutes-2]|jgi:electron transport complex protein RnfB|nr:MAG: electron transporter RnfB [Tenericutes bacterium HGW-Tenericutes-2]
MIELLYPFIVLGMLGIILGIVLSLANQYLTVQEDPRIDDIEKLLPNYNCGACGTPGCRAFATGIVNGEVKNVSRCKPGKLDKHFNPILEYIKDHPNPDGSKIDLKI